MQPSELVLASSSPRRVALLRSLGVPVVVRAPDVDESVLHAETPEAHAARLAARKATMVAAALAAEAVDAIVLGADTVVVVDGAILGKPQDDEDAVRMLRALSGRDHEVLTAVHVVRRPGGMEAARLERTRVRFRAYDDRWVHWYVGTGEPRGKAGAYSIQGRGALLSGGIEGSWTNVVGLPVEVLPSLFAEVGFDLLARLASAQAPACPELGVLSDPPEERTT